MTDIQPFSAMLCVFNYKQPEEKSLNYVTSTQISVWWSYMTVCFTHTSSTFHF